MIDPDSALHRLAPTAMQLAAYAEHRLRGAELQFVELWLVRHPVVLDDVLHARFAWKATSALSKAQILQQASTAMVAQANTIPQNILTLLQKLSKSGVFLDGIIGIDERPAWQMTYQGKAAMLYTGSWAPAVFEQEATKDWLDNYSVHKVPAVKADELKPVCESPLILDPSLFPVDCCTL